ncbi:MAG: class I SAM-dependent methyltransferase [Rhodospirillaceae bacterium]|nr:class I SAM-dependent methyltransferase [Rhodospirillaceae bacterium]
MLDRRSLFAATAAVGSFVSAAFGGRKAQAATSYTSRNLSPPGDVNKRGTKGRFERVPELDLESKWDFVTGFRQFQQRFGPVTRKRIAKIMEDKGLDPKARVSFDEALKLVEDDLLVQTSGRTWISNQQVTWKIFHDYYHEHAEEYLAEMETADTAGPGTLELNPNLDIPDYIRHEIHIQPGGYVGDEFAGHIYHHGTNSFSAGIPFLGDNEQDQIPIRTVERLPLPADGKVKRILDMGCGIGRMPVALKERFPEAEVWGIDAGGPMVRYAHMRANDLGVDVNFAQRLAEDTKFEDGYFDIVVSSIINHEIPSEDNKKVIAEAYRVTRKGGYYYPIDFRTTGGTGTVYSQYRRWWDHRWNCEPWSPEFVAFDFEDEIEKAGFVINKETKPAQPGFGARHAEKLA